MEALAVVAQQITFRFDLVGVITLAAGILILIFPKVLNYIVAAYLIVTGLIILFNI